jgi:hypothetical protein
MNQMLSSRVGRVAAASALLGGSLFAVATGVAAAEPAETVKSASVVLADEAEPVGAAAAAAALVAPPEVFAGFDNNDGLTGTTPRTNTVDLPAGAYSIIAKGYATNPNNDNSAVRCRLTAGSDFDESETNIRVASQSLTLAVVHSSSTPFAATLSCANLAPASTTTMKFIKIVATRVNSVTNTVM